MNVYCTELRWLIYKFQLRTEIRQRATSFIKEQDALYWHFVLFYFALRSDFYTHTEGDATKIGTAILMIYVTLVTEICPAN